jgi:cellulose synthase/poly-beta-1,6-N-acetylglucosamine synthase-like glycosyltransferase
MAPLSSPIKPPADRVRANGRTVAAVAAVTVTCALLTLGSLFPATVCVYLASSASGAAVLRHIVAFVAAVCVANPIGFLCLVFLLLVWIGTDDGAAGRTAPAGRAAATSTPTPSTTVRAAALCVTGVVAAASYFVWRIPLTNLNSWQWWWLGVPLAIAEAIGLAHFLGLCWRTWLCQSIPWRERSGTSPDGPSVVDTPFPLPLDPALASLPVFVLIPAVNEPREVLEPTLRGALAAKRALTDRFPDAHVVIALCNDGKVGGYAGWDDNERLAAECGVLCLTRTVGGGAKAGNLEHARRTLGATGDCLIAIFDADMVPHEDFLVATIGAFGDERLGWVQTRQSYRNRESLAARCADIQESAFYDLHYPAMTRVNAGFLCGTNLVVRGSVLDQIGGFPQDSVTEDFAASIQLQGRWTARYLTGTYAAGLGPAGLASFFRQQNRWASGTFGVFLRHWRRLLLPGVGDLTAAQRLQYLLSGTYYLSGWCHLMFVLVPLVYMFTGIQAIQQFTVVRFLAFYLPYAVLTCIPYCWTLGARTWLCCHFMSFICFPSIVAGLLRAVRGKPIAFVVTDKGTHRTTNRAAALGSQRRYMLPHALVAILCATALAVCCVETVLHSPGIPLVSGLVLFPARITGIGGFCAVWLVLIIFTMAAALWLDRRQDSDGRRAARPATASAAAADVSRPLAAHAD